MGDRWSVCLEKCHNVKIFARLCWKLVWWWLPRYEMSAQLMKELLPILDG